MTAVQGFAVGIGVACAIVLVVGCFLWRSEL